MLKGSAAYFTRENRVMENTKKGFTLVEVLIVVVIIAILASLIVPRMLMQTEKAKAAEAFQMMGAIKRAAERYYDFAGSYNVPFQGSMIFTRPDGGANIGDWSELGLTGIEKSKNWYYIYQGTGASYAIIAYDDIASEKRKAEIHYEGYEDINEVSFWVCAGTFKPIEPPAPGHGMETSVKGCTI